MNVDLGRTLIVIGAVIIVMGVVLMLLSKATGLPKLPGDIVIKKDNFVFYFPWVSSIVISIILSILFYLFFGRK